MRGAKRCRNHGGKLPKNLRGRLEHGLYSKVFTPEEKAQFEATYAELKDDPASVLLADAALVRIKAMGAARRAAESKDGMIAIEHSGTKVTSMVRDAAGHLHPERTVETVHQRRVDPTAPVSDALSRVARIASEAATLAGKKPQSNVNVGLAITEADAARILDEEFGPSYQAFGQGGVDATTPAEPSRTKG